MKRSFCYLIYSQEPQLVQHRRSLPSSSPNVTHSNQSFGGYNYKLAEPVTNAFQTECPVCRLLLRDPYQAVCCGTSFCHSCSQQVKADNNVCPWCREDFKVTPNKGLNRSIKQLKIFCIHRKDGCEWTGELAELENHLNKGIHSGKCYQYDGDGAQWEAFCSIGQGLYKRKFLLIGGTVQSTSVKRVWLNSWISF